MSTRSLAIIASVVVLAIVAFVILKPKPAEVPVVPQVKEALWPETKVIGQSVQGRSIEAFTYGEGKHHVVFVGGVHGGYEWNSVLLAYELKDYLDKNKATFPQNLKVTIIPSANPDGVFKVIGKEGRFTLLDVPKDPSLLASGRFNANKVDLNRNFDCKWQPESMWRSQKVSAGTSAFSEPEALAFKNFAMEQDPTAVVFWHSQADAAYGSQCHEGLLPETATILDIYSKASGYKAVPEFDAYVITGDAADWLATVKIPAITVELKTHEAIEWDRNLKGINALFEYYSSKP